MYGMAKRKHCNFPLSFQRGDSLLSLGWAWSSRDWWCSDILFDRFIYYGPIMTFSQFATPPAMKQTMKKTMTIMTLRGLVCALQKTRPMILRLRERERETVPHKSVCEFESWWNSLLHSVTERELNEKCKKESRHKVCIYIKLSPNKRYEIPKSIIARVHKYRHNSANTQSVPPCCCCMSFSQFILRRPSIAGVVKRVNKFINGGLSEWEINQKHLNSIILRNDTLIANKWQLPWTDELVRGREHSLSRGN